MLNPITNFGMMQKIEDSEKYMFLTLISYAKFKSGPATEIFVVTNLPVCNIIRT